MIEVARGSLGLIAGLVDGTWLDLLGSHYYTEDIDLALGYYRVVDGVMDNMDSGYCMGKWVYS